MTAPTPDPKEKQCTFWRRALWISAMGFIIPPLIGLGGTIFGMVRAFGELGQSGQADPAQLAGDISVAIQATLIGGIVSLIFLFMLIISIIRYRAAKNLNLSDIPQDNR